MDTLKLLTETRRLTREAGTLLRAERELIESRHIEVKGQGDLVSRADRMAEDLLREGLTKLLPGSVVMGEETSPHERGGEWRWIVDPLDGTANYLHGIPVYAVSVALEDRRLDPKAFGPRILGIVHDPVTDTTWDAIRGDGAKKNGRPIHVREKLPLDRSLIATGFPFRVRDQVDEYVEIFKRLYPKIGDMRRIGTAAEDLAWVADGTFDGFYEMDLKPWDLAAGALIIEESGGIITDWWGNDVLETGWVVCGNAHTFPVILEAIREVGFEPPATRWC